MSLALLLPLLAPVSQTPADPGPAAEVDPRTRYDVLEYELELAVRPGEQELEGLVSVGARSLVDGLEALTLDLAPTLEVVGVESGGRSADFQHDGERLTAWLPEPVGAGGTARVAIRYRGAPRAVDDFSGFHWAESADGSPWINTSCQGPGAHSWWPCKSSYFHPEDKPERLRVRLTVPAALTGVSNGRLEAVTSGGPAWFDPRGADWRTFHWRHDYPLETYTVTLNVGPYVALEGELELPGLAEPVPYAYYVLPESVEKARVQFAQVPELLAVYSEAFGPWPFPDSKVGLVETNFWGMEHSTAVAYGSSFPAWCEAQGEPDPYARRNPGYDYILVHELAHEWWGNAVSAEHWGHFWIHEGFGTYAEAVYVEKTRGREAADEWFAASTRWIGPRSRLYRGDAPSSGDAYSGVVYTKGAGVLNTLRHYLDDDEVWWRSLREFQLAHRYGNATTEDFRAVLERNAGRSFERFFAEWVYGEGTPSLKGRVVSDGLSISWDVENGPLPFHVPLDLAYRFTEPGDLPDPEAPKTRHRVWLEPGSNRAMLDFHGAVTDLEVVHLDRLLGRHEIEVESPEGSAFQAR